MAQILLVNPRKRKTARRKKPVARKKRRTAAQKRATAKMIAANRRRSKGRRKNPVRRKTRKKPVRRRASARRAPVRRRRRRSNPRLTMRSVQNQLVDAGTGAVGALGLDVVQGYLPIPANLKGGIVGTGVKALLAIGMGVVAQNIKIVRPATAAKMANGALTVVLHDELKKLTQQFAPGIQLGEYLESDGLGYYGSGLTAGQLNDEYGGMGTYLPELDADGIGMDETGLGEYIGEPEYVEDMSYT